MLNTCFCWHQVFTMHMYLAVKSTVGGDGVCQMLSWRTKKMSHHCVVFFSLEENPALTLQVNTLNRGWTVHSRTYINHSRLYRIFTIISLSNENQWSAGFSKSEHTIAANKCFRSQFAKCTQFFLQNIQKFYLQSFTSVSEIDCNISCTS